MADAPDPQGLVNGAVALVSAAVGGIVSAMAATGKANRKYQEMIDTDQQMQKDIKKVTDDHEQMKAEYDAKIDSILNLFTRSNGEPRFITYPAHDHMQRNCQQFIHQKIEASNDQVNQKIDAGNDKMMMEIEHIKETCIRIEETMERRATTRGGNGDG